MAIQILTQTSLPRTLGHKALCRIVLQMWRWLQLPSLFRAIKVESARRSMRNQEKKEYLLTVGMTIRGDSLVNSKFDGIWPITYPTFQIDVLVTS